jgi:hypothetical protein
MRRTAVVIMIGCLFLLTLAASQTPKVEVPVLPTERDQFGGRPGTFHFITNEQTMASLAELQKAFAALDSLDRQLAMLDPAVRNKLSPDLAQLRAFTTGVHDRGSGNAGKTAGEVEQRLNASKGKFMCGACHGHGMGMMMHGRGMGNMQEPD